MIELNAKTLAKEANVELSKWNNIPLKEELEKTIKALKENNINVVLVENKQEALEKIKELIPEKAVIMNGSSTTLIEIGLIDYLKKANKWVNLHEEILQEKDKEKQAEIRRKSVTAEYFLSGVNAITMEGEIIGCDASGSRVGAWPFAAKHLLLVSGYNKLTKNLDEALKRLKEFVFPLENARAKKVYGIGSMLGKYVVLAKEGNPNRTTLILIKEVLGF